MKLWSESFDHNSAIPEEFAFGKYHPEQHIELSHNRNPHLAWCDLPAGTQSLTLICHDPDVPSKADDVNQEGKTVPADLPRVAFYHWVLINIPPDLSEIKAAAFSDGITPGGKPGAGARYNTRQGLNDFTGWFASDETMAGNYYGYDGPCPPWNDSIIHHYHFTLYALDIPKAPIKAPFTGSEVLKAIEGHVLAEANLVGTYKINPEAK